MRRRTSEFSGLCKRRACEARLLAAGCPLDQAKPYGDCLTYAPGHYETWAHWRRVRSVERALRAIVRSYEYEDWPRGRIVFDRPRDVFILYADRKLLMPAMITCIKTQFHLPEGQTEVQTDLHYQSTEAPTGAQTHTTSNRLPRPFVSRVRVGPESSSIQTKLSEHETN